MGIIYTPVILNGQILYSGGNVWGWPTGYRSDTGGTTDVSIVLADGNTIGWYSYDASITLVGDTSVSSWGDKSGRNNILTQTDGSRQPWFSSSEGIMLMGGGVNMAKTAVPDLSIGQPITLYSVLKQVNRTNQNNMFLINTTNTASITQSTTNSNLNIYAGAFLTCTNASVGSFGILRTVFNGATSSVQWNNNTVISGNAGNNGMQNIYVGYLINSASINVKELIIRSGADSASNQGLIYNYLNAKYVITEPSTLLRDGNTLGWYRYDASTTLIDSSISIWADCLGSGRNLEASTNADIISVPRWSVSEGIVFDVSAYMTTAVSITAQPIYYYAVFKINTGTDGAYLFTGIGGGNAAVYQNSTAATSLRMYSSTGPITNNNGAGINNWQIGRFLFNGATSTSQINSTSKITGDTGTNGLNRLTLGAGFGPNWSKWSLMSIKELVVRNAADSSENSDTIYKYLKGKYGL